ncbi:hypothetical protein BGZ98_000866 [Dissophora globulifera]|nr:hypothetical protein BGZ98_000866 [Dissophora globulifera]
MPLNMLGRFAMPLNMLNGGLVPMQGHAKHDLRNPAALTNRYLQKRDLSSTPLTNMVGDMAYSLELGLGTPVQTFRVMIDTGSPITWVIGTNCKGSKCGSITDRFNPVASTLTASLGPGARQSLFNLDFFEVPFLNIIGNSTNTLLTDKVIGIWLEHQNSLYGIPENTSAGGEITFGGVNPARYTGDITYINCVGAAFGYPWSIPVGGITVDGQSIDVGVNAMAMIDTGTSLMLVPEKVSDAINSAIPGAQKDPKYSAWFLPCSGTTIITLTLGSFTAKIPYTHMAVQQYTETNSTAGVKYCISAAMYPSRNISSISNWLVGDLFLKNVYSVFDFGTNADSGGRIGFGQLSNADFSDSGDSGNGTPGSHNSATSLLSLSLSVSATRILVGIAAEKEEEEAEIN